MQSGGGFVQQLIDNQAVPLLLKLYSLPQLPTDFAPQALNTTLQMIGAANLSIILHPLIETIFQEFRVMDELCKWKDCPCIIESMSSSLLMTTLLTYLDSPKLHQAVSRLNKYILLAGMIREAPNFSAGAIVGALTEFTIESGSEVCRLLGALQR